MRAGLFKHRHCIIEKHKICRDVDINGKQNTIHYPVHGTPTAYSMQEECDKYCMYVGSMPFFFTDKHLIRLTEIIEL